MSYIAELDPNSEQNLERDRLITRLWDQACNDAAEYVRQPEDVLLAEIITDGPTRETIYQAFVDQDWIKLGKALRQGLYMYYRDIRFQELKRQHNVE